MINILAMGTYYRLVNVTKRAQFQPANIKRSGFTNAAQEIIELLLGDWHGDEVRLVCDESGDPLYEEGRSWPNRWSAERTVDGEVVREKPPFTRMLWLPAKRGE